MLDGAGQVRITDFGLAGMAGETVRAGTPAYMAPEQLAGSEVTAQSDIYALGLVLYELFTGQRAIEAKNVAELRAQAGGRDPSAVTDRARAGPGHRSRHPALPRARSRAIGRPRRSAVAAALPGGDPLAAALAAGETPSPEMVAAAGESSALSPLLGHRRVARHAPLSRRLRGTLRHCADHPPVAAGEVAGGARGSRQRGFAAARLRRCAGRLRA